MPDDKSKVGEPDRSKVAEDQDYEVNQLAQKYGISSADARKLIKRAGNDRENSTPLLRCLSRAAEVNELAQPSPLNCVPDERRAPKHGQVRTLRPALSRG